MMVEIFTKMQKKNFKKLRKILPIKIQILKAFFHRLWSKIQISTIPNLLMNTWSIVPRILVYSLRIDKITTLWKMAAVLIVRRICKEIRWEKLSINHKMVYPRRYQVDSSIQISLTMKIFLYSIPWNHITRNTIWFLKSNLREIPI